MRRRRVPVLVKGRNPTQSEAVGSNQEGARVGEDEDGVGTDAEHEVERDNGEDGELGLIEHAEVDGDRDGEAEEDNDERVGSENGHAEHRDEEDPDRDDRDGDEPHVALEAEVEFAEGHPRVAADGHLDRGVT